MQGLASGFWWVNVILCTYSILYWARKRFPDGTHALLMPSGQIWIWQLIFALIVLALDASPWHLLWLGIVSIVISVAFGRIQHHLHISKRIKEMDASPPAPPPPKWTDTVTMAVAASLLSSDIDKSAFYAFLREQPSLAEEFHLSWIPTFRHNEPPSRWRMAVMLNEIGVSLADRGDFFAATKSLACSSLFVKTNPLTWSATAEVYCAWEDQIAAMWAAKVISFRLTKKTPVDLQELLSTDEARSLLREARKRMKEIVAACDQHEEWRNTFTMLEQMGVEEKYFDR